VVSHNNMVVESPCRSRCRVGKCFLAHQATGFGGGQRETCCPPYLADRYWI